MNYEINIIRQLTLLPSISDREGLGVSIKWIKRFVFFVVFFFLISTAFAQPEKDKTVTLHGKKFYRHIVLKGETVYGISRDFRLSPKDIVLENPKAIDGINPGDTLNVPMFVPGPVPSTQSSESNVKKGTTDSTNGGKYIF